MVLVIVIEICYVRHVNVSFLYLKVIFVSLQAPEKVETSKDFDIEVEFKNPFDFPLTSVKWDIDGPRLTVKKPLAPAGLVLVNNLTCQDICFICLTLFLVIFW